MEASSTSHFWGRTSAPMDYCVRLIPAQHVKAFVRSQKNDANDALAICETVFRPGDSLCFCKNYRAAEHQGTSKHTVKQGTGLASLRRSLPAKSFFW